MHFSMKISYLFSSVYGRARGGGSSAYCGTGGSAWWSHWIYLSCYIVDFPCDESQILTDPSNKESVTFSPTNTSGSVEPHLQPLNFLVPDNCAMKMCMPF